MKKLLFIISCIVAQGSINAMDPYQLHEAVKTGNRDRVLFLLDHDFDVNHAPDCDGFTALHQAASGGNIEIIQLLIDRGANINQLDAAGKKALYYYYARFNGHQQIVQLLSGASQPEKTKAAPEPTKKLRIVKRYKKGTEIAPTPTIATVQQKPMGKITPDTKKACVKPSAPINVNETDQYALQDALHGEIEQVKALLEGGNDANKPDGKGRTALHRAIMNNGKAIIQLLLDNGADINAFDNGRETPLHIAVELNRQDVVQLLLAKQANVNSQDARGWTPLHYAAERNYEAIVKLLLDNRANFNVQDTLGKTPLHWAAIEGNISVVKLLLDKGADVFVADNGGYLPSACAGKSVSDALTIRQLINDQITRNLLCSSDHKDITFKVTTSNSPLKEASASEREKLEQVRASLSTASANANLRDDSTGRTELHWAAQNGFQHVVQLLLEHGAELELNDNYGDMPIHLASLSSRYAILALFLDHGANINAQNFIGDTPLHVAAVRSSPNIVKLLLDRKSFINQQNFEGITPLHLAAAHKNQGAVYLLLEHHANINLRSHTDDTPLHAAVFGGCLPIVQLFLDRGTNINATNNKGSTALHYAALYGHKPIIQLLLDRGANVDHRTQSGLTALDVAIREGHPEVAQLIKEHTSRHPIKIAIQCPICLYEETKVNIAKRAQTPCCHQFICQSDLNTTRARNHQCPLCRSTKGWE